jgi:hypothetical protein
MGPEDPEGTGARVGRQDPSGAGRPGVEDTRADPSARPPGAALAATGSRAAKAGVAAVVAAEPSGMDRRRRLGDVFEPPAAVPPNRHRARVLRAGERGEACVLQPAGAAQLLCFDIGRVAIGRVRARWPVRDRARARRTRRRRRRATPSLAPRTHVANAIAVDRIGWVTFERVRRRGFGSERSRAADVEGAARRSSRAEPLRAEPLAPNEIGAAPSVAPERRAPSGESTEASASDRCGGCRREGSPTSIDGSGAAADPADEMSSRPLAPVALAHGSSGADDSGSWI